MKEHNIERLIEASPFSKDLPYEVKNAILDFFVDTGADIENINVDDFIVNGLQCISRDDLQKYYTEAQREDLYILLDEDAELPEDEKTSDIWILN